MKNNFDFENDTMTMMKLKMRSMEMVSSLFTVYGTGSPATPYLPPAISGWKSVSLEKNDSL